MAARATKMGKKWSRQESAISAPSSVSKERMEQGKKSRVRMSAKGGSLVGGCQKEEKGSRRHWRRHP